VHRLRTGAFNPSARKNRGKITFLNPFRGGYSHKAVWLLSKDIFSLLTERSRKRESEEKQKLLRSLGIEVPLYFTEGTISINTSTCRGAECKLCVKLCPTNALYWSEGKVGITKELCVWCAACVLCCVVDDCIRLTRTRSDGKRETFSTPKQVLALLETINRRKSAQATINRILGAPRSKPS